MFHIVEFNDDDGASVDIVPSNWIIDGGKCYWPPVRNVKHYAKTRKNPEASWKIFSARPLGSFETHALAVRKLPFAEETSDLNDEQFSPSADNSNPQKRLRAKRNLNILNDNENRAKSPPRKLSNLPSLVYNNPGDLLKIQSCPDSVFVNHIRPSGSDLSISQYNGKTALVEKIDTHVDSEEEIFSVDKGFDLLDDGTKLPFTDFSSPNSVFVDSMTNNKTMGVLRKLAQDVAFIKMAVNNLEKKLDLLVKKESIGSGSNETLDLLQKPLNSIEEFLHFESSLLDYDKTLVIKWIKSRGGETVTETVGRMLRKLMTNKLGTKISLWGLKGNYNFSASLIWQYMKEAVMSRSKLSPDEKKIETATKEWFRHAGDRLKHEQKQST